MKKDFLTIIALFVLSIGCSVGFYQCKKSPPASSSGNVYRAQETNEVWIQDMAFGPRTIIVAINTTVVWTNKDVTAHTVTSTTGLFNSGNMRNGDTYSYVFNTAGRYPYRCTFHSGMTGTVIVK